MFHKMRLDALVVIAGDGTLAIAHQFCNRGVPLGGVAPTSFDRVLATRFGRKAVELVSRGEFGTMVAFAPPDIVARRLDDVVGKTKKVPMDFDLLTTAKAIDVTFGD